MKFTETVIALAVVVGSALAVPLETPDVVPANSTIVNPKAQPYSINLGNNGVDNVAWISGDSKCSAINIGPVGSNPCSRPFNLRTGGGFSVEGCGSAQLWINQNGGFWGYCGSFGESNKDCGITSSYHCN